MATIKARRQANGTMRYTAVIRLRRGTIVLHQESKTFAHRSAAVSWAKHREVELENPGALTRVQQSAPTLAELIRWYIDSFECIAVILLGTFVSTKNGAEGRGPTCTLS